MLFSYDFYSLEFAILKVKIEIPEVELLTLSYIVCMKTLSSSFIYRYSYRLCRVKLKLTNINEANRYP